MIFSCLRLHAYTCNNALSFLGATRAICEFFFIFLTGSGFRPTSGLEGYAHTARAGARTPTPRRERPIGQACGGSALQDIMLADIQFSLVLERVKHVNTAL